MKDANIIRANPKDKTVSQMKLQDYLNRTPTERNRNRQHDGIVTRVEWSNCRQDTDEKTALSQGEEEKR